MSKVEWFLWSRLRGRQLDNFKFRRQVPIGPYFADFACLSTGLVIELDGENHGNDRDDRRDAFMERAGYRVLRISANEIDDSIEDVMDAVYGVLIETAQSQPHPPDARSARARRPPRTAGR